MWTAACLQGILQCFDQIACVHMSGLFGDDMATDDPSHGGITAQTVGVVYVVVATKTAKHRLAELPDHAMPPVLAGTAVLENTPGNLGQAKGVVKLLVGEQSGI